MKVYYNPVKIPIYSQDKLDDIRFKIKWFGTKELPQFVWIDDSSLSVPIREDIYIKGINLIEQIRRFPSRENFLDFWKENEDTLVALDFFSRDSFYSLIQYFLYEKRIQIYEYEFPYPLFE